MKFFKHSYIFRILKSLSDRGILKTLRLVWEEKLFPLIHGVNVGGLVFPEEFEASGKNLKHAVRYEAISITSFNRALSHLDIDPENYNFIDLGCGKGLALFLAHRRGFGKVIGVEFEKKLAEESQKNLSKKVEASKFEIFNMDATAFIPPITNNIFFLNNPFDEKIVKDIFSKLSSINLHHRADDFIVYNNALHKESLVKLGYEMTNFDKNDPLNIYAGGIAIFRFPPQEASEL